MSDFSPEAIAVAFDRKAPTFRHEMYDRYKAGRKGMPDELAAQMPYVKLILTALGIEVLEVDGWEADDIIGTIAKSASDSGNECIISTGDRDSFQLINDKVRVSLASTKEPMLCDTEKIKELYGVLPPQMLDVKALMGDSSDNIPGVPGIGEKTALSLIQNYESVENIYKDLGAVDISKSVRAKLEAGEEMCRLSYKLGKIAVNAPVSVDISDYIPKKRDEQALADILTDLEMFALLKKFNVGATASVKSEPVSVDENKETKHLDLSITAVYYDGEKCYSCGNDTFEEISVKSALELLNGGKKTATFNLKQLLSLSKENYIRADSVVFDTTLAAYLLNVSADEYSLMRLCAEYGVSYSEQTEELPRILAELNNTVYSKLCDENMEKLLTEVEIPLACALSDMEKFGVALNKSGVVAFGENLTADIDRLSANIYELCGEKFNIASPKQLGEILFEKLHLPIGKKTKTGYSTKADVIEFLMDKHPVVAMISEYRSLTKLYSTYVQACSKS